MCRLLGYLGSPILLNYLLNKPEHSLIVQSYQPREMTAGLLNADGFGIGWYHAKKDTNPFTYKNTLPIWNDINLPNLSRYIESNCIIANVRSATPGLAVDLNNCHPFDYEQLLFTHNGFIENFRQTLYRPMRERLSDRAYQSIKGSTDSEHIFALLIDELEASVDSNLEIGLHKTLLSLDLLARSQWVTVSANVIISDGHRLVGCRFAHNTATPSLYWLRDDPNFPDAVLLASEPLFQGNWIACPERSILTVGEDLDVKISSI
jgi:ergothioneine biosynthesis protein EgtC